MRIQWFGDKVAKEIRKASTKDEQRAANLVARDAKASTLFKDVSGALRRSIKAVRSRYKDGGYLVMAGGRDAWYTPKVELGHKGVPARPFMRSAKRKNATRIKKIFEGKR